mmetsp:Transcript_13107/g.36202  ORF Transcript_13107/g.36202 Transcript_13107/m.36202 type:complete len:292 (-) Transcript_13107:93-968(-)
MRNMTLKSSKKVWGPDRRQDRAQLLPRIRQRALARDRWRTLHQGLAEHLAAVRRKTRSLDPSHRRNPETVHATAPVPVRLPKPTWYRDRAVVRAQDRLQIQHRIRVKSRMPVLPEIRRGFPTTIPMQVQPWAPYHDQAANQMQALQAIQHRVQAGDRTRVLQETRFHAPVANRIRPPQVTLNLATATSPMEALQEVLRQVQHREVHAKDRTRATGLHQVPRLGLGLTRRSKQILDSLTDGHEGLVSVVLRRCHVRRNNHMKHMDMHITIPTHESRERDHVRAIRFHEIVLL